MENFGVQIAIGSDLLTRWHGKPDTKCQASFQRLWEIIFYCMGHRHTNEGQPRQTQSEICLYNVKDGKIISEQFFY